MAPDSRLAALTRIVPIPDSAPKATIDSAEWSLVAVTPLVMGWPETPNWLSSALSRNPVSPMEVAAGTRSPKESLKNPSRLSIIV
jgi:hypothetical protein